ncbi:hypothetical protein DES44_1609 [Roseateles depolymerans]|uniref:Uncharacterized protein n=1 Tax=Roseateles depolymerans TaxID=76731 RepID=A0A0U3MZI7_9BURK|nr:hypothetical protein RD2015_2868 [Roseateles depolymerans]REG22458.1 hypothetical protein DES44_1609 [Roseateles depolymerans]
MNALIPTWIIGAPLLLAIIDWIRTPKVGAASLQR